MNAPDGEFLYLPDQLDTYQNYVGSVPGVGFYQPNVKSQVVRYFEPMVISLQDCHKVWDRWDNFSLDERNICAVDLANTYTTCGGDTGSPLVLRENMRYLVLGVHLWSSSTCKIGFPSVFTRVGAYNQWITDTMSQYA